MADKSQLNAAMESIPKGYSTNDPQVQDMFADIQRQQNSAKGIIESGIMGAAAGGQAAQGLSDPYAAFIQGAAAGLQVPAALYQKRSAELRNALDAAPLSKTMPELVYNDPADPSKGMKPGYEIFASMPTKLAQQAIAQIGQDALRLANAETAKSIKSEKEGSAYLKLYAKSMNIPESELGITGSDLIGMTKADVDNVIRTGAANRAAASQPSMPSVSGQFVQQEKELANAYGVPATRVNPYFGLDAKVVQRVQPAQIQSATKEVEKAMDSADASMGKQASLARAAELLEKGLQTGPVSGRIPGRTLGADAQEFDQIASTLLPAMRQGMPGAVSDRDMAIFRSANIGLEKDENVNRQVIQRWMAVARRDQDYAQYLANYQTVHGDIAGAKAAWKGYTDRNPLFDQKGNVLPVQDFSDYFSGLNEGKAQTVGEKAVAAGGSKTGVAMPSFVVREINGKKYKFDPVTKKNLGAI